MDKYFAILELLHEIQEFKRLVVSRRRDWYRYVEILETYLLNHLFFTIEVCPLLSRAQIYDRLIAPQDQGSKTVFRRLASGSKPGSEFEIPRNLHGVRLPCGRRLRPQAVPRGEKGKKKTQDDKVSHGGTSYAAGLGCSGCSGYLDFQRAIQLPVRNWVDLILVNQHQKDQTLDVLAGDEFDKTVMSPGRIAPSRRMKQHLNLFRLRVGLAEAPVTIVDDTYLRRISIEFQNEDYGQSSGACCNPCQPEADRPQEEHSRDEKHEGQRRNAPFERRRAYEKWLFRRGERHYRSVPQEQEKPRGGCHRSKGRKHSFGNELNKGLGP